MEDKSLLHKEMILISSFNLLAGLLISLLFNAFLGILNASVILEEAFVLFVAASLLFFVMLERMKSGKFRVIITLLMIFLTSFFMKIANLSTIPVLMFYLGIGSLVGVIIFLRRSDYDVGVITNLIGIFGIVILVFCVMWFFNQVLPLLLLFIPSEVPDETFVQIHLMTPTSAQTFTPSILPTFTPHHISTAAPLPTALTFSTPDKAFTVTVRQDNERVPMVYVPAGAFMMGITAAERDIVCEHCRQFQLDCDCSSLDRAMPSHYVYVDAFWIDRQEVNYKNYKRCIEDAVCDWMEGDPLPEWPVTNISWEMANTYCQWRGGRLPSESEWEKAARWDPYTAEMRLYPWGNQAVAEVQLGARPSAIGADNMAGGAWEWVLDGYAPYNKGSLSNPIEAFNNGDLHIRRGGSGVDYQIGWSSAYRDPVQADFVSGSTGFRCIFPSKEDAY